MSTLPNSTLRNRLITTAGDFQDLKNRIKGVLQFSKVESLTLMQIDSEEIIYEILDAYGQNLRSLKIGIPKDRYLRLEFSCIFSRCPKLESLFLDSVSILDDFKEITGFDELTEFVWNIPSYWSVYLKNILSAPKLKKLALIGISNYDCKDLRELSELIENGSILGQLEQFQIITNPMESKHSACDSCLVLPPLRHVIFNASAFLPKLSSVDGVFNFFLTEWDAVVGEKYKNDPAYLSALKLMQKLKAFKSYDPLLTRLLETFNNKMLIFVFK